MIHHTLKIEKTPLSRYEYIKNMTLKQMKTELLDMFEELCEDGMPSPELMEMWLNEPFQ